MYPEPPPLLPEEAPPPRKRKPAAASENPLYMPVWAVLLLLVAVFGAAACIVLAAIGLGGRATFPASAPEIIILTAVPTPTPEGGLMGQAASPTPPLATAQPLPDVLFQGPTLAPTTTPTTTPAVIAVGAQVEVVTSGGARVRASAGTDDAVNRVLRVVSAGQVFDIIGGPQPANGLTFWQVRDPQNGDTGWIAEYDGQSQILQVVQK
jgi:hypothetical protein